MDGLGSRLKKARESCRLTQIEVSKKLGISNGTLSGYERNYRDPDTETLSELAKLYNVSIDWLLTGNKDSEIKSDKTPFQGLAFLDGGSGELDEEEIEYLKESLELFRRMKERKAKEREGK